ncbi:hypothetical protein SPHINGO391_440159 [Sphingomonas aurantiaca]|uniref:Uncharacterized protein n=1 Tax=Sphingomonas aurantiaca TaxID=185949 RepID=A0A5E7Z557_9SPHN|nr:hypothetical protein SPHINGO391_440159 [Sphingomonas aurantiaca]
MSGPYDEPLTCQTYGVSNAPTLRDLSAHARYRSD